MNRTDRLLAIVLQLQAHKHMRAEDLAAVFEVTKRTIYRDMLALMESGVPVVSMPGHGYSLIEGYFLPPLSFSTDEAIMLLLGSNFVARNFDTQYRDAAQNAGNKINAVLPERLRDEVNALQSSIQLVTFDQLSAPEALFQLRQAIIQHKTVRFTYHARYTNSQQTSPTHRDADPYALIHIGGSWMLVAYCHLRQDIRNFRLDRIDTLTILEQYFKRPPDFQFQLNNEEDRTEVVRLLFDSQTARRVKEAPSAYQVTAEDHADGLLVTLRVRHPDDVLSWVLSWGAHVRVLEPESLRQHVIETAQAILQINQSDQI